MTEESATSKPTTIPRNQASVRRLYLLVGALLAICFAVALAMLWERTRALEAGLAITDVSLNGVAERLEKAEAELLVKDDNDENIVDLSETSLQRIGAGFLVAHFALAPHLTGVKVRGMLVNGNAVGYRDATFRITIGEQKKEFHVKQVPVGGSSRFEVYVPDVPVSDTKWAEFTYVRSTISYRGPS